MTIMVLGFNQPPVNEYRVSFPGVKWLGYKADHNLQLVSKLRTSAAVTSTPHKHPYGIHSDNYTSYFILNTNKASSREKPLNFWKKTGRHTSRLWWRLGHGMEKRWLGVRFSVPEKNGLSSIWTIPVLRPSDSPVQSVLEVKWPRSDDGHWLPRGTTVSWSSIQHATRDATLYP